MSAPLRLLIDRFKTPLGQLAIVADDAGRLCAVEWTDQENRLQRSLRLHYGAEGFTLKPAANPAGLSAAIHDYFDGKLEAIDGLPVVTGGTPFQRKVWQALRQIPCGRTLSYGALAKRIGRETAVRAVGHANGDNPISIVVPCHRVIGANGTLTGYGGGIERKRWLLAHEGASVASGAAASRARS
jgi:methylated-DNA-[protein]-cysteine S-methyltransferase